MSEASGQEKSPDDGASAVPKVEGKSILRNVEDDLVAQQRDRLRRNGEHLSLLCCGEAGCGKSTLINSLFVQRVSARVPPEPTLSIQERTMQVPMGTVTIALTTIDTPGYGDSINLEESFERITTHMEDRMTNAMDEERKAERPSPKLVDQRAGVDAVLYFIGPHRLKEWDVEFMRRLHKLATVIPVISKADVYTRDELRDFKAHVCKRLQDEGIETFCEPYAIICGSFDRDGDMSGREYPWGCAESENSMHSDLPSLRRLLITEGLTALHERRRNIFEQYRRAKALRGQRRQNALGGRLLRVQGWLFRVLVHAAIGVFAFKIMSHRHTAQTAIRSAEKLGGKETETAPPKRKFWPRS